MAERHDDDPGDIRVSDRRAFGGLTVDDILAGKTRPEEPAPAAAPAAPATTAPAPEPKAARPPEAPSRPEPEPAEKKSRLGGLFGRKGRDEASRAEAPQGPSQGRSQGSPREAPRGAAPSITFVGFISSLAHSALMGLGEEPDPFTGETRASLPAAKQTIDLLALLAEKTRGNLDADEDGLFQAILTDLRLRYVEATRRGV